MGLEVVDEWRDANMDVLAEPENCRQPMIGSWQHWNCRWPVLVTPYEHTAKYLGAMIAENRQLVTDESVEFEK